MQFLYCGYSEISKSENNISSSETSHKMFLYGAQVFPKAPHCCMLVVNKQYLKNYFGSGSSAEDACVVGSGLSAAQTSLPLNYFQSWRMPRNLHRSTGGRTI